MLQIENLNVYLSGESKNIQVLDQVSFRISPGETLGIVGESGCGKSMTALSILGLISSPPLIKTEGKILWKNNNLLQASLKEMRKIRGKEISMIFQEPMTALNPVIKIGDQIREIIHNHLNLDRKQEKKYIIELLEKVGISDPARRVREYPHELSGGMRQRVMIAIALACKPGLLIADEPTTALDVTIQAQILEQLKQLQKEFGMSILFISHDLNVISYLADKIIVMYSGEIAEEADVEQLFKKPEHPYTKALQAARPHGNPDKPIYSIPGNVPSLENMPKGCRFYDRCSSRMKKCREIHPNLQKISSEHRVRCLLHNNS